MLPKYVLRSVYASVQFVAIKLNRRTTHEGIQTVDLMPQSAGREAFFSRTIAALQLIRETDPTRFSRLRREIHYIVHTILPSAAEYRRLSKICCVDFSEYPFAEFPEFSLKAYTCTLIHESAHGYLHSKAVPDVSGLKREVERICTIETIRFAQRFKDPSYDWRSSL